jgi:putative restriction endonuclease
VPFLFKLHAPDDFIVGGGFFVSFSALPARLAWGAFGEKNGVSDYARLKARVGQYRSDVRGDPEIGCNVLNGPFFFEEQDWVTVPETWARNIVRGRTFDTEESDGLRLWSDVAERLQRKPTQAPVVEEPRYGAEYLARARIGQGAFRVLVTEAYDRRCAITGERTLPVLEAAHIKPYAESGPHQVSNGLLLRADLHLLFDDGYLTLTDDLRVEVSGRIRDQFENGRDYYRFHGQPVAVLPKVSHDRPASDFLRWHQEAVFLG